MSRALHSLVGDVEELADLLGRLALDHVRNGLTPDVPGAGSAKVGGWARTATARLLDTLVGIGVSSGRGWSDERRSGKRR
jgi:hypothetical protein